MAERWRDVTPEWSTLVGQTRGAWPYHTATWGELSAEVFGGEFRVMRHSRREWYAPVLLKGTPGADGFACGHIGYGGVLAVGTMYVPLGDQLAAVTEIEDGLGLACARLVTTPGTPEDVAAGTSRHTLLVRLSGTPQARWDSYAGSVRTAIRKCRLEGLQTRELVPSDAGAVVRLIHATQQRVGALYRVPEELVARLVGETQGFSLIVGCFLGDRLLSVGVFLRAFGRVAYLFNGWDSDHARLGANYLMLHAAIEECSERGDQVMDLGFSHGAGLRVFKERWNGQPATLTVVERPVAPHRVTNKTGM
ncbi:GNAT family N-acetyltransferase [Streptomyces rubiginosohelvolus]|uniref:GNAT family N-acetyltransferase n=1 Tax=Streptomyces rubiginosohelvolus TaxID=67362 RepID=UPI003681A69B